MKDNKQILNEFQTLKKEYKINLETLKPEPGLKNIPAFKDKVNWALNHTAETITTESEPIFKVEFGNMKLPKTTIISSCGTWFNCSGRTAGFCDICQYCYDKPKEIMFKKVLASRQLKEVLFRSLDAEVLADMIIKQTKKTTLLNRFNEVSELRNQQDLKKVITISNKLYESKGILSYIYTHNKSLDFTAPHPNLRINGSNFYKAGIDNEYRVLNPEEPAPKGGKKCICDCHNCNHCIGQHQILYEYLRK